MIYYNDLSEEIDQCNIFQEVSFNCEGGAAKSAILLTPRCDLVLQEGRNSPKAKYLKFAAITDAEPIVKGILSQFRISKDQLKGEEYIDEETFENVQIGIKNFVNGAIYPRYFFIPALDNAFGYSVIDFQIIEVKKYSKELFQNLRDKRISQIKSSWREAIPVRYSNYSSRIGLQDYPEDTYDKLLQSLSINLVRSS